MEIVQDKDKRTAAITTTIICVLLALIFFLFGFSYVDPLPENGIVIAFGKTADGMGDVIPETVGATATPQEAIEEVVEPVEAAGAASAAPELVVADGPTELEIRNAKKRAEAAEAKAKALAEAEAIREAKEAKEREYAAQKAVVKGLLGPKAGGSSGDGSTTGMQGDPNGAKDGGPVGGFGPEGISYTVGHRKALALPKPEYRSYDEGTVVVSITVDRNGNVIMAMPGAKGSTTASPALLQMAKEAALNSKFNADPEGRERQVGSISYVYALQ